MKLYHGSNTAVKEPQILKSDRKLDFGAGFYLTSSFEQAERWAQHVSLRRGNGHPVISIYEFSDNFMTSLKVKIYPDADKEWLLFVVANRSGQTVDDGFDLIIGPVADDQTVQTITLFAEGFLDVDAAIRKLKVQKLKDQFVIKSASALNLLQFKEFKQL